jgi:DNA polymerase
MNLITLDFETYYAQDFSLSKLTTEEYIRDKRFEVIGVGVKFDDGVTKWFSGSHLETQKYLSTLPWNDSALLCHNTMFDGAILAWKFGIKPKFYLDTLCMGRATNGVDVGGSLAYLSERYNLGKKGTEVLDAKGKNITGFSDSELTLYGEYCKNDVELTFKLFQVLSRAFPQEELDLIDMTLRMFINPILEVDDALLSERLEELKDEKFKLLGSLKEKLECDSEEAVRKKLASNKQFAAVLEGFGVQVPMKESKTTGKLTYALAKNDMGFIALTEHEDVFIQQLAAVRLGTKSTIEESRIERFIDVGSRNRGRLPIPLKYYGAHTGRWAGSDKVNFQNLPSRDKKKKALKQAVVAPEGYKIINCDSSQIEARVLAYLSGQKDLVKEFQLGDDVYSIFASKIYERPITKENPIERFVGKTCILGLGYGTGALKLQHTLKTSSPGADLSEDKCKEIVNLYRNTNDMIVKLWREGDSALKHLADWQSEFAPFDYGESGCVKITKEGFLLPNGLYIRYPDLKLNTDETNSGYQYQSRKGPVSLWGGSIVENVVQALARIIVGEQMLKLAKRYRPVLTVHDAAVCVVPEEDVDEACAWIVEVMSTPPDWAKNLPIACEAQVGYNYGEMEEWKRKS